MEFLTLLRISINTIQMITSTWKCQTSYLINYNRSKHSCTLFSANSPTYEPMTLTTPFECIQIDTTLKRLMGKLQGYTDYKPNCGDKTGCERTIRKTQKQTTLSHTCKTIEWKWLTWRLLVCQSDGLTNLSHNFHGTRIIKLAILE